MPRPIPASEPAIPSGDYTERISGPAISSPMPLGQTPRTMMLAGFMSRWMIPWECAQAKAAHTWIAIHVARSTRIRPSSCKYSPGHGHRSAP